MNSKNEVRHETCQISGQKFPMRDLISANLVSSPVTAFIQKKYPNWSQEGYISVTELSKLRQEYMQETLQAERGELSRLESEVLEKMQRAEILARNISTEVDHNLTFGQRLADKIAEFGGSWTFIISFFCFIALWMGINTVLLLNKGFDPYPYILLNLILSCLAALQAPVIMMSQNRQEAKDRQRSQYDYQVNLKAELEIRQLHEKIDHLLLQQSQRLFEIQQVQIEFMEMILKEIKEKGR